MIIQGFTIGNQDWCFRVYYNITKRDLVDLPQLENLNIDNLFDNLNTGYTLTNFDEHSTIILIGSATNTSELYDTVQHELKHATEHISEYYGVNPRSEEAAYLQGEIARKMFPAVALMICPAHHQL